MSQVDQMQNKMANSAGSAQKKFDEAYGNSTEAKINNLKNAMQRFWIEGIQSNTINGVIGVLGNFVGILDTLVIHSKGLGVVLIALSVAFITVQQTMKALRTGEISGVFVSMGLAIKSYIAQLMAAESGMAALQIVGTSLKGVLAGLASGLAALATNPLTWIAIAASGVVALANAQRKHREEVERLTNQYKELKVAIDEANVSGQKMAYSDLQKQQNELDALIAKRDKLNKQNPISREAGWSRLEVEKYIKTLEEAGYTVDKTTSKIKELEVVQSNMKVDEKTQQIINQNNARIQQIDYLTSLMGRYQELSNIENKTKEQEDEMSIIAQELKNKYGDLQVAVDKTGKYYIIHNGIIGEKIKVLNDEKTAIQTKTQIEMQAARDNMTIQVGMTTVTVAEAKKRILALQAEANALRTAFTNAMPDDPDFNWAAYKNYNRVKSDLSQYIDAINKIASEPSGGGYSGSNIGGSEYTPGGDSKSGSTKQEVEDMTSLVNKYYDLENAIKAVDNSLEELRSQDNYSTEEEIALMEKKITLQKQLQTEYEKSANELKSSLSSKGFTFGSDGSITNYADQLTKLTNAANKLSGDAKKKAIDAVKDVEKEISDYTSLVGDKIPESAKAWREVQKAIDNIKVDSLIKKMDKATNEFESSIDELKDNIDLAGDYNMEKWVGNTQDLVNKIHEYEAYLQKVISELRQQQSTLVQGSEAWNTINDKIASAVDQARHLRMEANNLISDMLNSIVEANQASNEASLQAYEASINAQISALETQAKATEDAIQGQIDSLESQEEAMEKRYEARQKAIDEKEERYMEQSNAKIDAIRKEIEALEKQNEIETEEEERQKRILDIQKLREQLQNKMNQKTVQQLTQQEDGTWQFEYTYDEAEVQSIQDQIKQQEEDFAKWEQDNQLKHQKELLEARIQAEEQVQEEQKKSFDAQREALEEQMNSEKEAFENRRKTLENQLEAERNAYEQQRQALEQSLEAQRQQMEQNNKQMEDMVKQLLDAIKNNVDGSTDDLIQTLGEKLGLAKEQIQELLDLSRQAQQASNQINSQMPGGNSSSNYGELPNGGYYYYGEGFAGGGVVDFTGGTTVHGTPTQSEVVFNSSQAKKLYDWVRNLPALPKLANFMNIPTSKTSEKKENHFHIARLELPNITNESGLKKVWDDLELLSHQYNPA